MAKTSLDHLARVEVRSIGALRQWLFDNHSQKESIWLVTHKKATPDLYVAYADIVDGALCFGWIDSLPRKLDDERTMTLLSPRKAKSGWSAVNKAKVAKLEAEGRMHPAGRAAIVRAKADGSWDLLNTVDALIEPDDLKAAFVLNPVAKQGWEALARSLRRGLLEQIVQAKKPETRAARIAKIVSLAGERG